MDNVYKEITNSSAASIIDKALANHISVTIGKLDETNKGIDFYIVTKEDGCTCEYKLNINFGPFATYPFNFGVALESKAIGEDKICYKLANGPLSFDTVVARKLVYKLVWIGQALRFAPVGEP